MANTKLTALSSFTPIATDILYAVDDPAGTPVSGKVTVASVLALAPGAASGTDVAVADGGTGASTAAGAATNLGLGTGDSPQFTAVNIGAATDTTITRVSAGVIAVEGSTVLTGANPSVTTLEIGAGATDTTLSRSAAGKLAVEGIDVVLLSGAQTLTNKTLTSPTLTTPVLGTPSSGTLTNCTGLPQAGTVGLTTADSPQFTGINLGAASDTTLTRVSAGLIAVEGITVVDVSTAQTLTNKTLTSPTLTTPALGTPSALVLTNATGLPQAGTVGLTTADSPQFAGVNVGAATDTTITRVSAGVIAVEGLTVATNTSSPSFTAIDLGAASATDTTLSRSAAGVLAVEGKDVYMVGGADVAITDGGTGASTAGAALSNLGIGTGNTPQFTGIELGHATDTTITRVSAGVIAVEGQTVVTGVNPQLTTIELGHATDTTISRSSAGVIAIEGQNVVTGANPQLTTLELGHASDTTLARSAAGRITVEGNPVALASETEYANAAATSGTFTPSALNGNFQTVTLNGATAFAPPSALCTLTIGVTNGASAASLSTSGFTKVDGDSYATTDTFKYIFVITKQTVGSWLTIKAMQ